MKALLINEGKVIDAGNSPVKTPISMLQIEGIPLFLHQVELLKKYHITDIVVYGDHSIEELNRYFGDGKDYGIHIEYIAHRGATSSAKNRSELRNHFKEDFILIREETLVNMDLKRLIDFHQKYEGHSTFVVHSSDHPFNYDLIETNRENKITRYLAKPHNKELNYQNLVSAGVWLFAHTVFDLLDEKRGIEFDTAFFSKICSDSIAYGYVSSEYFKDILTNDDLFDARKDYETGIVARRNFNFRQKAIFLDRDGVMNEEVGYISKPDEIKLYDSVYPALRKIITSEYISIVITNQSSIARGFINLNELKAIHNKMETDLANENVRIDALYFCPHHPDRIPNELSEFQVDCLCRKPKPGLLLDSAFHFNIDLNSSFIIGDSERDIKAGLNADCTTVGVMTGYGLRNSLLSPDFLFANISEAADFIIDEPYKYVFDQVTNKHIKTPCIILIGGQFRSGKTILASYLNWKIKQAGKTSMIIHLDNWMQSEKTVNNITDIFQSYPLEKAETDVQQILAGISTNLLAFSDFPEGKVQEINNKYKGEEYVIIEGSMAFNSKMLQDLAQIKIFVQTDPEEQKSRFTQMMDWQGKEYKNFSDIYNSISSMEINHIVPNKKYAHIII